jgi:hypothetical protein
MLIVFLFVIATLVGIGLGTLAGIRTELRTLNSTAQEVLTRCPALLVQLAMTGKQLEATRQKVADFVRVIGQD